MAAPEDGFGEQLDESKLGVHEPCQVFAFLLLQPTAPAYVLSNVTWMILVKSTAFENGEPQRALEQQQIHEASLEVSDGQ